MILTIITTIIPLRAHSEQLLNFNYLIFLVYTVWACLKAMTLYNTLKEEPTNKNHNNDNYN